jgi:membrane protein
LKPKERIKQQLRVLDKKLDAKLKNFSLPGFRGKSIYHVGKFFFKGLFLEEDLSLRASSLAFNFFIAIFPLIIFLFTLIPYIPITNFQEQVTDIIKIFLPENAFDFLNETINDIITIQNPGLLSFGFLAALYFSTNGFATMIAAFDVGVERKFQRNWFDIRIKSVGILFLVVSILITTILVSLTFRISFEYLEDATSINGQLLNFLVKTGENLLIVLLIYFVFSSIYFFGSERTAKWKFFSPGSTVATVLSLITTYGFSAYVENFNSYNKLYGSIGTLLVLMVLIYFNSFVILIGYELNRSIDKAS